MDLLILATPFKDDPFYDSFLQSLSENATVFLDDFESFSAACNSTTPQMLVLLSYEDTLPSNWDIQHWNIQKPIIVLVDVKKMYLRTIDTLREFLKSFTPLEWNPHNQSFEHPLFRESLAYIEENLFDSELCLSKVASHMYVSRCYYSRMFRNYLGTGFKEYIIDKRIQKAKLLLREGNSVTEACFAVGYNDLTHFSRIFKKLVGTTPSTYRKNKLSKSCLKNQTNCKMG